MAKKSRQSFKPITSALQDCLDEVNKLSNEALNEATELTTNKLVAATPVRTGITKSSWENVLKYNNVKFIHNLATTEDGRSIPILNLIEFGSKGHPFAIKTFESAISEIESTIINKLNK